MAGPSRSKSWRLVALASVVLLAVCFAAVTLLRPRRPAPPPVPTSGTSPQTPPVAPGFDESPSASASGPVASPEDARKRPPLIDEDPETLAEQREVLFRNMKAQLELDDTQLERVRQIVSNSRWMGSGNPKITRHPLTRRECLAVHEKESFRVGDARCGAANMVALFDPSRGESAESAAACIDQYEFPNIACDYPLTWVKANEAAELCEAVGKRLCDAHEWEGGCAGALKRPEEEYAFGERRMMQEYLHNKTREVVWAYGKTKDQALCATGSAKSPKCYTPSWELCGSNTYPAGSFPRCVSALGVYDQHGNAAEHMNLPLTLDELTSRGGSGETEMKGSWFIFLREEAHIDDCRWRALGWHAGKVRAEDSHRNYHLGFRCCKNLAAAAVGAASATKPTSVP